MQTTNIQTSFNKELRKEKKTFTGFVIGLSNELGLQIPITDIHDDGFEFLLSIRKKYSPETITGSQFIFLTIALAFRQHSKHPENHLDLIYVDYLMSMIPTIKKRKILSSERLDFYTWFVKNRKK